jgi:alpha-methylacyl-CoA racemase
MALQGIKVLEFSGLAPAPFCGMILADFGAEVIRIDKANDNATLAPDVLGRGKKSLALNLKNPTATKIVLKLCDSVRNKRNR